MLSNIRSAVPFVKPIMRSDALKNYDHLLETGREVIAEQGVEASMREVARRAGVGIGTLYRHFPSREALLEALLRKSFDKLTATAGELATAAATGDALVLWLRDMVALTHSHRGVLAAMTAAIAEPDSALHASCVSMRASGTELLARAQAAGEARRDIDGADLLLFGNAERALVDLTHRLAKGENIKDIRDLRGTAFMVPAGWKPGADWGETGSTRVDVPGKIGRKGCRELRPVGQQEAILRRQDRRVGDLRELLAEVVVRRANTLGQHGHWRVNPGAA